MFEKLKDLRQYEGLTQKEVADILNVTRDTYAGWECGKDIMPLPKINDFANYFHVNIDYIMGICPNIIFVKKNQFIDKNIVANHLKEFRLQNHLSQQKLANSLHTSQSNIHNYETGKTLITTTYALEFSKQYKYSLDKLVGRNKNN